LNEIEQEEEEEWDNIILAKLSFWSLNYLISIGMVP